MIAVGSRSFVDGCSLRIETDYLSITCHFLGGLFGAPVIEEAIQIGVEHDDTVLDFNIALRGTARRITCKLFYLAEIEFVVRFHHHMLWVLRWQSGYSSQWVEYP